MSHVSLARLSSPPETANAALRARLDRLRLQLYSAGLFVAFSLYLVVHASLRTPAFWTLASAALAALAYEFARLARAPPTRLLKWAAILAVVASASAPLGFDMASTGRPLPALVATNPVWSQILVALFAARVLMEENAFRFQACLRDPLSSKGPVRLQSTPAAFSTAVCLLLIFYCVLPVLPRSPSDPALETIVASVAGSTSLHAAVIFLFFAAIAHLGEAAIMVRRERAAFERVRAAVAAHVELSDLRSQEDFGALLHSAARDEEPSYAIELMRASACPAQLPRSDAKRRLAAGEFRAASRRFVRSLIAMMPMLGFLGTIVGLSTTLARLPAAVGAGPDPSAGLDFSGALAGLSIKFQTTLLGLLGSMICTFFLASVERRESELEAECVLLVDTTLERTSRIVRRAPHGDRAGDAA